MRTFLGLLTAFLGAAGILLTFGAARFSGGWAVPLLFALVTLVLCWSGWRLLFRRHPAAEGPWEIGSAWADLPDPLPSRPRTLGPVPPPACAVPADVRQRRLWKLRAELAFDQLGNAKLYGWGILMAVPLLVLVLVIWALLASDGPFRGDGLGFGIGFPLVLAYLWLLAASPMIRFYRRHFGLRRLQRSLEAELGSRAGHSVGWYERYQWMKDEESGAEGLYHPFSPVIR
ncbi:hypothetical protein D5S17_26690 [Pseudonocardiaceae bacterium YIM PH 21723]|nr:hypothetical protein D5S17_26690 [Pseudonocardiaceae bacterium YIM PH 21723]